MRPTERSRVLLACLLGLAGLSPALGASSSGATTAGGGGASRFVDLTGNASLSQLTGACTGPHKITEWDGAGAPSCIATPSGVTGPGSSADKAIARFSGTGGATLQDSPIFISDSGLLQIGGVGSSFPALKNSGGDLFVRNAADSSYRAVVSSLFAALGDDGSYPAKLEGGSSGGVVLASQGKIYFSEQSSLGGVTSGDTVIDRGGVATVRITNRVTIVPSGCGTCDGDATGTLCVSAGDKSLCYCNGTAWTATPLTGSCS